MPEYPMPSFEDVVFEAIVKRFFEPMIIGIEFQNPGYTAPGQLPISIPVPKYGQAPLAQVSDQMYRENADRLAKMIWEKIDVEALTERLAKSCIEHLFGTPNGYGNRESADMAKIRESVRERVAAELTRRQLAKIDAEDQEAQLARKAAEDAARPVEAPDYDPLGEG